jgi:hypothetical protein
MEEKIKLALTVSKHFHEVYNEIMPLIDAIVIRDVNEIPKVEGIDKTCHLNGFINKEFDSVVTKNFLNQINDHNVKVLSFDFGPSCEKILTDEFYFADSKILDKEEIISIGRKKIDQIRRIYHGDISLENLDYHRGGAYEHVCDPSFIKYAIEKFDVSLTLDIGHLMVTCYQFGLKPRHFIQDLPMERLKELHISHAINDNDAHEIPTEDDYAILQYILNIRKPEYIVFEYYWNKNIIIEEMKKLYKFINRQY